VKAGIQAFFPSFLKPLPAITYDLNGNMTARGSQTLTWDVENRLVTVSGGASFVYDGDGNRVKKTEGGQTTVYVNKYYEKNVTTGEVTTSYYLGSKLVAQRKGTTLSYVMQDHLGSTSVTANSSGISNGDIRYTPFGHTRFSTGIIPTDKKFTGQRLDATGLYYYGARYYDATIGRFISPDTIVPNFANPQSLNRYSYCYNNPLRYTDPTGHFGWGEIVNAVSSTVTWAQQQVDNAVNTVMDTYNQVGPVGQTVVEVAALAVSVADVVIAFTKAGPFVVSYAQTSWTYRSGRIAQIWTRISAGAQRLATEETGALNSRKSFSVEANISKFTRYIFRGDGCNGKEYMFTRLGYNKSYSEELLKMYADQAGIKYASGEYELSKTTEWGTTIKINIDIPGINQAKGQSATYASIWQLQDDGSIRLVTPYGDK
jgi:RHS repeat-associated protein